MRERPYQFRQAQQIKRRVNEKVSRYYTSRASEGLEVDEDLQVWKQIMAAQTDADWWIDYKDADFLLIIEAWKKNHRSGYAD